MKSHLTVALFACIAGTYILPTATPANPQQSPAKAGQRWEYAQFMVAPKVMLFLWHAPDRSVNKGDAYELYTAMGGKKPANKYSNTEFLNLVGADGWELLTIQEGATDTTFWFKRVSESK